MRIQEIITETATAESTSASNIASTGNSPHIAVGTPDVIRRWGGSPGKMGKSVKHKPVKSQSAKDNPVTNPGVGNNLVA
jgi:hypothetical protein